MLNVRYVHVSLRSALPRGGALPDDVWRDRHRGVLILLWIHVPALFVFALIRGNPWAHAIGEGGLVAAPAMMALLVRRRRRLSTVWASIGLMTASAVLVHLSGGVIEAHFHFFVMVGVVVLYQDWWPYLVGIAYVVMHHTVLGTANPHLVYDHRAAWEHPLTWAAIHGVAILAMSAAGIANWRINERHQTETTDLNAMLGATLESTAHGILVVTRDGRVTGSNATFASMYRLPPSILVDAHDKDLVRYVSDQLENADDFAARIEELYAQPEAESEDILVFRDGRVVERSSKPQRVAGVVVGRV